MECVPAAEAGAAGARFGPHLVVTDQPKAADGCTAPARARISPDPARPSTFSVGGRARETANPSLGELLAFVDEVRRFFADSKA